MSGNFNGQILVDKLTKLNGSQQSIETLSHWCIFHRKNAKQVVETWDRQFHCSSRDQRVAFLYLANDILQNSRRKGSEFVVEFWKVLSDALSDVLKNGDESDKRAATRLIDIWEERKVFGSRGQDLKEELLGVNCDDNRNGRMSTQKLKKSHGEELEKIISSYDHVYNGSTDEDTILRRCQDAVSCVEKLEKDFQNDTHSVGAVGSGITKDLRGQHAILRETIEHLKASELSRAVLVSHLKESLREQELKLQQVRNQLQAAQVAFEMAGSICEEQINRNNAQPTADVRTKENMQVSDVPSNFIRESQISNEEKEKSAPVMYTPQILYPENPPPSEDDNRKSVAAAVAAKLAASPSSHQMLSYVLSSLASEGVIGQQINDVNSSGDQKRAKLDNGVSYSPNLPLQPPPPAFPHPDSLQKMAPPQPHPDSLKQMPPPQPHSESLQPVPPPQPHPDSLQQLSPLQPGATQLSAPLPSSISLQVPPPPPSLTPLQPPLHPNHFMQNASPAGPRPMTGLPYSYGSITHLHQQLPLPNYQMPGIAPFPGSLNTFHNAQMLENGGFSSQPPLPGTAPPTFSHH